MSIEARLNVVSPHHLARAGGQFASEIAVAAFPRLSGLTVGAGVAAIALRFRVDERNRSIVEGAVRLSLTLQCQRCLEPVRRNIEVPVHLCLVESDVRASELMGEVDTFVLHDEEVSIIDLIEDDLLLALPSQVCQAFDECPDRPGLSYPANEPDAVAADSNPFGVLAKLKAGGD
jgi:DUF177 domain-containing protein